MNARALNKKEALADLKSDSNKACKQYLKCVKEEKAIVELNINLIKDKCSKTEDLESFKDSYPKNYGMRPAKEICSNKGRLVDKNKAFNYHQKAADMENINRMYSIRYCNTNGFGTEEDKHKEFEHYKKSTNAGSANRTSMKDANKKEIIAFGLDVNSIEDKYIKIKDFRGLDDNYYQSLNINIQTNSTKLVLKDKIENDFVSEDQIKKISLEKDASDCLKIYVSNRIAIRYKISNNKNRNKNKEKKDMVSSSRMC
ncbi:sel1 repeat domain-containing protein [Gigaspora margarita]|uniref:Sel1 repeat domain-containing protein n=1 Tax=Gigaspora margarita TaxID=4874 RepID=A0A8H4ESZ8_GIGMA|nr:sel1 repeat domain-containing protein [Gigaspora margarita]